MYFHPISVYLYPIKFHFIAHLRPLCLSVVCKSFIYQRLCFVEAQSLWVDAIDSNMVFHSPCQDYCSTLLLIPINRALLADSQRNIKSAVAEIYRVIKILLGPMTWEWAACQRELLIKKLHFFFLIVLFSEVIIRVQSLPQVTGTIYRTFTLKQYKLGFIW